MQEKIKAAVAQVSPVYMDRGATVEKTIKAVEEAARNKAQIVVFSETHIPGYPYWRGANPISRWSQNQVQYMKNAVTIPGPDTDALCEAARDNEIVAVVGCTEMSDQPGSNTLYNTILFIDSDGTLLGRHRKLMPTHGERTVWGMGDSRDLQTFKSNIGTLGGLVCYEHHMTLTKAAMAALGEEIHCALWDGYWVMDWHPGKKRRFRDGDNPYLCDIDYAVREYAIETQNFVLSACQYIPDEQMPEDTRDFNVASGGSSIVNPAGVYLVQPTFNREIILYAELDQDDRRHTKAYLDALGHYARWDLLRLDMRGEASTPFAKPDVPYGRVRRVAEKHGVDPDKLEKMIRDLEESSG